MQLHWWILTSISYEISVILAAQTIGFCKYIKQPLTSSLYRRNRIQNCLSNLQTRFVKISNIILKASSLSVDLKKNIYVVDWIENSRKKIRQQIIEFKLERYTNLNPNSMFTQFKLHYIQSTPISCRQTVFYLRLLWKKIIREPKCSALDLYNKKMLTLK